jgi:hypothetical protein
MLNATDEKLRRTSIGIAKNEAAQQQFPRMREQYDEHHLRVVMAQTLSPFAAPSWRAPPRLAKLAIRGRQLSACRCVRRVLEYVCRSRARVPHRCTEVREMTKKKIPAQVGAHDVLWSAHGSDGYF